MTINTEWLSGKDDLSAPFAIRRQVFIEEQHVGEAVESDAFDHAALHLVVYADQIPVGTGRVYSEDEKEFMLGRVAVKKEYRGRHFGERIVGMLLKKAFILGAKKVNIHAQAYIAPLYEKFGFVETGGEYMLGGMPHVNMTVKKEDVRYPPGCITINN